MVTEFYPDIQKNIQWLQKQTDCFDLKFRSVIVDDHQYCLVFMGGITGNSELISVVESFVMRKDHLALYASEVADAQSLDHALNQLLCGLALVLLDEKPYGVIVDTRNYPSRKTSEPSVEKSIRGARDGFTEHIMINLGLIRRRIRDPKLTIKAITVGNRTKTDVFYFYIRDLVDETLLDDFNKRVEQMDKSLEINSERQLCMMLYGQTWNPYPHVRYSERPDVAAIHLLQGSLILLVDNSPSAVVLPTTFLEQTRQIEEYTLTPLIATVISFIRMLGVLCSIYLLPLWVVLVMTQNETLLHLPIMEISSPFTFGIQVLIVDLLIEMIRLSLIHTPSLLSSLLGVVTVFVLGDAPISYGAYTQEILIMSAIANIGNFVTASYELSLANKICRLAMIVVSVLFGFKGFLVAVAVHFFMLVNTSRTSVPYLYPFFPYDGKELKRLFIGNFRKK